MDGSDFHGTFTQVDWWTIYAVRTRRGHRLPGGDADRSIAVPPGPLVDVVGESNRVVSVHVRGRRLDRLRTRSGQFFIWRFLDGPGWSRANPYTISAAPTHDRLRVTIQNVGEGSGRVNRLKPGTRVFLEGPYGSMTAEHRSHPKVLLLAAGVGITPIRALLEDTPYAPGEAILLYDSTTVVTRSSLTRSTRSPLAAASRSTTYRGRGGPWTVGCRPPSITAGRPHCPPTTRCAEAGGA